MAKLPPLSYWALASLTLSAPCSMGAIWWLTLCSEPCFLTSCDMQRNLLFFFLLCCNVYGTNKGFIFFSLSQEAVLAVIAFHFYDLFTQNPVKPLSCLRILGNFWVRVGYVDCACLIHEDHINWPKKRKEKKRSYDIKAAEIHFLSSFHSPLKLRPFTFTILAAIITLTPHTHNNLDDAMHRRAHILSHNAPGLSHSYLGCECIIWQYNTRKPGFFC